MNQVEDIVLELRTRCKTIRISATENTSKQDTAAGLDRLNDRLGEVTEELPDVGLQITTILEEILEEKGMRFSNASDKEVFVQKITPTVKEITTTIIRESL